MKENTDRKAFSMTFFQRFFMGLQQFMAGRRGTDALALATMIVGLVLCLVGQILWGWVGFSFYCWDMPCMGTPFSACYRVTG